MNKGGYQIVDLGGKSFTLGTGRVVDGVYDKIEGTRKPIYVSGIVIADVEYHDTYVDFTVNQSNFEGTIYGKKIVVQNNDVVTISAISA